MEFTFPDDGTPVSVGRFLKRQGISHKLVSLLKKPGCQILVKGSAVYTNYVLQPGDRLVLRFSEQDKAERIIPRDLPVDIVYEDEDLLVADKPAGMPIQPCHGNLDGTLANALAFRYPGMAYHCVNRLDRDTTGLTIVAKDKYSAALLSEMAGSRQIRREYLAIVEGRLDPPSGEVSQPIARVGTTLRRAVDPAHGRPAATLYQTVRYYPGENISLVKIELLTGRTHQIRVHMDWLGHPLVGDFLYNPQDQRLPRQALHAWRLSFRQPVSGQDLVITAGLPQDMKALLERAGPNDGSLEDDRTGI